ncbi:MAG TPA: GspE/PulE family protein [Candidatus Nitrosotenuis sp.]|jgi:type II secretory ATPase GspE/PulE/Tfp pilus assembly ATPase PilB-like protein|nr:GspE/PulE family protein [Candidatus Nitrosotenuis sp.]
MTVIGEGAIVKFGQFLIERGLLRPDQVNVVLREQERRYRLFGQICVDLNFLTDGVLLEQLSDFHQLGHVHLQEVLLNQQIVAILPKALALQCQAILMDHQGPEYTIAMVDPLDVRLTDLLQEFCGREAKLTFYLASYQQIMEAIDLYYPRQSSASALDTRAIELIQDILNEALDNRASDVHFRPENTTLSIWFRIDGVLEEYRTFHKEIWDSLLVRLKILSKADVAESRRPQTGSFELAVWGRTFECRVAFHPTIYGENVVIRMLDRDQALKSLSELGMTSNQEDLLQNLVQSPDGILFISGPTGAGKTTTLYALLQLIDAKVRHVMTLEDPVEYHLPQIRQTEIVSEVLEFPDGIRSLLRQDPDVVFISEIRDHVTAGMALRAALTGHLVLATIHARDNLLALHRLKELGVPSEALAGILRGLINQRLIRRFCQNCQGQGCQTCHYDGYHGRMAIAEIFPVDFQFHQLLAEGGSWSAFVQWREQRSIPTLAAWAQQLVDKKLTSLSEVHRIYRE